MIFNYKLFYLIKKEKNINIKKKKKKKKKRNLFCLFNLLF